MNFKFYYPLNISVQVDDVDTDLYTVIGGTYWLKKEINGWLKAF